MAALKTKLQGSALFEALIAMVLIALTFSISLQTFDRMTDAQRNYLVLKAELALKSEAEHCKVAQVFIDGDISYEGFTVRRRITTYPDNDHLATLTLTAVNEKGKIIAEYYELIFV